MVKTNYETGKLSHSPERKHREEEWDTLVSFKWLVWDHNLFQMCSAVTAKKLTGSLLHNDSSMGDADQESQSIAESMQNQFQLVATVSGDLETRKLSHYLEGSARRKSETH